MLARLQSRNLDCQSPSYVPNELFGFMNRRFDLKNSFFSSTRNTFRDPKWHSLGRIFICPCADVVLWRCVGIKEIY